LVVFFVLAFDMSLGMPKMRLAFSGHPCTGHSAREVIPGDRVQCRRDQFVGLDGATSAFYFEALGFPNVVAGEVTQPIDIFGYWIVRCQQIPGARASAIISNSGHERLLKSFASEVAGLANTPIGNEMANVVGPAVG
jgi:hypothetical protein